MPPSTLPYIPTIDTSYPTTSDYYWGTIHSQMDDVSGLDNHHAVSEGPFGFGSATLFSSGTLQCKSVKSFAFLGDACAENIQNCTQGLSFSIWEKTNFTKTETLDFAGKNMTPKYIVSTGGDENGHPGIALYHKGLFLTVIISTGLEFWKVSVMGRLYNNTWNNIGVRWTRPLPDQPTKPSGLELFINLNLEGKALHPGTAASAKAALSPPEFMINCHKDSTDTTYREFNDAAYDEMAMWMRPLLKNETSFFLGGYHNDLAQIDPASFQELLRKIDLSDPNQQRSAVEYLKKATSSDPEPTNAPPTQILPSSSSGGGGTGPGGTQSTGSSNKPATPSTTSTPGTSSGLTNLYILAQTMKGMTDKSKVPKKLTPDVAEKYLNLIEVESNMLESKSLPKWKVLKLVNDTDIYDSVSRVEEWTDQVASNILLPNGTGPVDIVKSFDNIVPTFIYPDPRCESRPISITTFYYNTYDAVAPVAVNPSRLNDRSENVLDSTILRVNFQTDKVYDKFGDLDLTQPTCLPDKSAMARSPLRIKLEHKTKKVAIRKLAEIMKEKVSDIEVRHCVWWNTNVSAWDSSGCIVYETTAEWTKCNCDHFGTFAVLIEKVEPIAVPPQSSWLIVLKYFFYALSAIVLVVYMIVVARSRDLQDQFHLMGVHLAVAAIFGTLFMVLSDFQSVRNRIESNIAVGTLLHFFYGAVGCWVASLGYASFKAITSGVVQGMLMSFAFLSWGFALLMVGVPYLVYSDDLGTDPRCFISWNDGAKWIFFIPQLAFGFLGSCYAFVVLCNLATSALRKENLVDDYVSFTRGASYIMLHYTATWTFGLLAYIRFRLDTDFWPIFQICNSLMRKQIRQLYFRRRKSKKLNKEEDENGTRTRSDSIFSAAFKSEEVKSPVRASSSSSRKISGRPHSKCLKNRPGSSTAGDAEESLDV